ncbi:polysaccharide lyase 8 family protein [Streptomyces sp. SID13031]|uniref:polysaccharide lyase 8 family protein n=1 Tax=Streptomyces sp. SID13031 TaxID=2706046 RepID=UPI0013CC982F|nr:polysaccharide lyase 8 family protein [Streptomyces sp. SID13031]NEA37327.1 polysaccharide lyase 8 family protein [Streptomyces sp. SID13031]
MLKRRTFLAAGTATVAAMHLGLPTTAAAAPADFAALRAKWAADLTGGESLDPADPDYAAALTRLDNGVKASLAKLDRSPTRNAVFTDYPLAQDPSIANTYVRLEQLATAWATPGSAYHSDPALLADLQAALESMDQLIYKPGTVEFGNWWSWEIGATRPLANTMILLYAELAPAARERYCAAIDHFVSDPYWMFPPERGKVLSTGANRVDLCQAIIVRALVTDDEAKLTHARDGLSDTWQYVTTGDGFYRDGSFVQHTWVAYTGTYGHVLLSGIGKLLALLANSPWQVTDPKRQILFDSVAKAYLPVVHDARMMDFVRGRAVSRFNASDHNDGYTAAEAILRLAQGVDPLLAAQWRSAVAGWLQRDTFGNMLSGATIPRVALVKSLRGVTAAPERDGHTLLASMDRSVHRRSGWAYSISMASSRIAYYESGNGENEQGYHSGSGMTYLYDRDNGQYADAFWPTVDRTRLPGTTVDKLPLPPKAGGEWGAARPTATWVGGSTLDGYAAIGQDLHGPVSPMRARKSWFCLDQYVVALGAGITGTSGHPVETVIENRNLHSDGVNALTVDDVRRVPALGDSATVDNARWAHLDGVGGYIFPTGSRLQLRREVRTGSWRDINTGGPTTPITRRYLTMWQDHGVNPSGSAYNYVVAPGASLAQTKQLARFPSYLVLRNTAAAQAVLNVPQGLTLANFWQPDRIAELQAETPCSVIGRLRGREFDLAISDPTQLATTVQLTVLLPGLRVVDADPGITTVRTLLSTKITVDVTGAAGATRRLTLRFR